VRVDLLGARVVRPAVPARDLREEEVCVAGAGEGDDGGEREERRGEVGAVREEGRDVLAEGGETLRGEGAEGERGGWGRDVVGGLDVVEDLDELGGGDGDAKAACAGG